MRGIIQVSKSSNRGIVEKLWMRRLREERKRTGLTIAQLAGKIGKSTSVVGHYEDGKRRIDVEVLVEIADVFGIPAWSLLVEDPESITKLRDEVDEARGLEGPKKKAYDAFCRAIRRAIPSLEGSDFDLLASTAEHLEAARADQGEKNFRTGEGRKKSNARSPRSRPQRRGVPIPIVGTIAAGAPITAVQEDAGESIEIPEKQLPRNAVLFALRVRGESMADEGIHDGDTVICRKQEAAQDHDRVVALIKGQEATLKKFYREPDGRVRLQPANAGMAPLILPERDVRIQGTVVTVVKATT